MAEIYKICPASAWREAEEKGVYTGSPVDQADGFIHLSAGDQVRETARRHFAGQHDLVLVAFKEADLENLVWEVSRGGAKFPHVYDVLPADKVLWVKPLPLENGLHRFPPGIPE